MPIKSPVIATTGKCGRELFTLADRRQHLYQVGSMGGAAAMVAVGVRQKDRPNLPPVQAERRHVPLERPGRRIEAGIRRR